MLLFVSPGNRKESYVAVFSLYHLLFAGHHVIFFKSEAQLSLVLGGIRTHNLLILGQTPKSLCLGAQQEDSCLPEVLI